jgi:hypothetical protein
MASESGLAFALHNRKTERQIAHTNKTKSNPTQMKKILLTIAMLGVALASTASAHPHGGCYQPGCHSYWWYPTYCGQDYDDCDYPSHPHHRHQIIVVP